MNEMFDLTFSPSSLSGHRKAIVLLSGGMDSSLVALSLTAKCPDVTAYSVDYPGRTEQEREAAATVAEIMGIPIVFEELPTGDARHTRPNYQGGLYEAWLPYRNLLFLGLASAYALINDATVVAAGFRASDNRAFADSDEGYLRRLARLLSVSGMPDYDSVKRLLYFPLVRFEDKPRELLVTSGVATEMTEAVVGHVRSCWRSTDVPCGECRACVTQLKIVVGE